MLDEANVRRSAGSLRQATLLSVLIAMVGCAADVQPEPDRHSANRTATPAATQPETPPDVLPKEIEPRGTVMIIYAAHLADAAAEWRAYREASGWSVISELVPPTSSIADGEVVRARVQDQIRSAEFAHGVQSELPFAVLLLGDVADRDGRGIPTFLFPQKDSSLQSSGDANYATDEPYQIIDEDDRPDIALGRVPARTNDEALQLLEKIGRYEQDAPLGPWRRKLTFVAGEGHYGLMDRVLESLFRSMIERTVPTDAELSLTYASPSSIYCPPPDDLQATVIEQIESAGLLFNYIGHGHARGLDSLYWNNDRIRILERHDLDAMAASAGPRPIGVLTCCSTGWYDLPDGELSFAEALLFHESGPIAVIAGSRITHPYANAISQKDLTELVLSPDVSTVGELDLRAAHSMREIDPVDIEIDTLALPVALAGGWPSSLTELRRMHTGLYNLLGDPCTRIARHEASFDSLSFADGRLTGVLNGIEEGTAFITLETATGDPANRDELIAVDGANDPDLPAKAKHNHRIANDHVIARFEMTFTDGRLDMPIDPSGYLRARVLRVYARGADAQGRPVDATGAIRIEEPATTVNR